MKKLSFIEEIRLRMHKRYEEVTTSCLGFPIKMADKSSFLYMFKEIFIREIYKFATRNPEPYIVDCGANIGLATLYFKSLFPSAKIIAFEPDPKIFKLLKENIESSDLKDIELIPKGLSKGEGEIYFFSEGADGGRLITENDTKNIIKIRTIALSPFLNRPVDFLKIDIEGSEVDVLVECQDMLKNVHNIFVEYHSLVNKPGELSRLLVILEKNNFRYYIEQGGVNSKNPFMKIEEYLNYDFQLNIFAYKHETES